MDRTITHPQTSFIFINNVKERSTEKQNCAPLARVRNLPLMDEEDAVLDQRLSSLFHCRK
jgi:hypothetical protein